MLHATVQTRVWQNRHYHIILSHIYILRNREVTLKKNTKTIPYFIINKLSQQINLIEPSDYAIT